MATKKRKIASKNTRKRVETRSTMADNKVIEAINTGFARGEINAGLRDILLTLAGAPPKHEPADENTDAGEIVGGKKR